jgi:putative phage-type endonuclease
LIRQDDPSWLPARVGKLTASRMADAMDYTKAGKPGAARMKYMRELLAERLVGAAVDHYVTPAMQWGLDNEGAAADAYEAATGNILMPAGLLDHPAIYLFAATPDRFLGGDGLAEIKCPTTATFIEWTLAGEVPEQHKPQMLAQMACSGRKWCEFIAYDPRVPVKRQLFVRRYAPGADEIAAIERAAAEFLAELDAMFCKFTEAQP